MNSSYLKIFGLLAFLVGLGSNPVSGQNILIFSTSHNSSGATDVSSASGILKLRISAFSPILEVRVNGETQSQPGKTSARLDYAFKLKHGENRIPVSVKTEKGELTKVFILNRAESEKKPGEDAMKPFQMIVMGSAEHTDNATSSVDDEKADVKVGLTLIPSYQKILGEDSTLLFQGVLLRERYASPELASPQVEYLAFSSSWLNTAHFGDWQLDAGYSDIGSTTASDATRADIETGLFFGGSVRPRALDSKHVKLGAKYTLKSTPEPPSDAHDGNGGALALTASWDRKLYSMKLRLNGGYELNDAKGMYQDYTVTRAGVKASFPLNRRLDVSGLMKIKQTVFAESDPLKGDTEASSLTTVSVQGSYKLPVKGLITAAAITRKNQSSNISCKEYSALLIGLSLIYVYQ